MQERQHPSSESESSLSALHSSASRGPRSSRLVGLVAAAGAAVLALFSTGCPEPGDLDMPSNDYYCRPGESIYAGAGPVTGCKSDGSSGSAAGGSAAGGSAAGGSAAGTPADCEVDCVKKIFTDTAICGACHGATPLGGLDLSKMATANLKDVPAKHTLAMTPADCPTGDKLIDSANPAASWLLIKLKGEQKGCGTQMPQSGPLDATNMACMETYVSCVAGAK